MIYTQHQLAIHMLSKINNELRACRLELAFLQSGELQPRDPLRLSNEEFKAFSDLFIIHVNETYPDECFSFEFSADDDILFVDFHHNSVTYIFQITQDFNITAYTLKYHSKNRQKTTNIKLTGSANYSNRIEKANQMFADYFRQLPPHSSNTAYGNNIYFKYKYHNITKAIIDMNLRNIFSYSFEISSRNVVFRIEYIPRNKNTSFHFIVNKTSNTVSVFQKEAQDDKKKLCFQCQFNDMQIHDLMKHFNEYFQQFKED